MSPFLVGMLLLLVGAGLYIFVNVNPATLARGIRTFTATFAALASTGLLLTGRFGLALITVGATIMALRALRGGSGGSRAAHGAAAGYGQKGKTSEIVTNTLVMQLDHRTGDLDGDVLVGPFAGRSLASLGLKDLLQLLGDCQRDDPRSVPLLETYLDRHQPDWRRHASGGNAEGGERSADTSGGAMDKATACSILEVSSDASPEEIKAAHRRLMNKLHPDHGGSSYLAAQLNQAKDVLLGR